MGIIEIQVQKQRHFLKRFNFYLADQLVENAKTLREQGHTHEMYEKLSPVYGIAILEKSILPRFQSPVNVFNLRHDETFEELTIPLDDGSQQSLSKLAFIELDKYNKDKKIKDQWLQWLEYFGNYIFSKEPIKIIEVADQMLDSSRLTKEEKAMLDERLLRQEHHDMDIYSAREEGIELEKRQMVRTMFSNGASIEMISQLTDISLDQVKELLSQDLTI